MPHTRFNLKEAAAYLHLPEQDLQMLVKRREVPCEHAGGRVVFKRSELDAWASQRLLGFNQRHLEAYHRTSTARMHDLSRTSAIVSELLAPGRIEPALASRTKSAVMRDMVDLADRTNLLNDKPGLLQSVIEREKLCSTALSGGMAVLHAQHHEPYQFEDSFIVLARAIQPVPFGSPDGRTTDIFFLMCCQDDRIHLHVLARLCMLCNETMLLPNLRECADAQSIYDAVNAEEMELIRRIG